MGGEGSGRRTRGDGRHRLRMELGLRLLSAGPAMRRPGAPAGGVRLPSVRAYALAAGVHRNTAAAVYRDLERLGLVRCVRGSGTFAVEGVARDGAATGSPACASDDLRPVLGAELGREVVPGAPRRPTDPLLVPLDEVPPREGRVVPVAPDPWTVRALSALPDGAVVRLVSRSPRAGRLLRAALLALRRPDVGLERRVEPAGPCRVGAPPAELTLVDARELGRFGTRSGREVFLPLRLLTGHRGSAG